MNTTRRLALLGAAALLLVSAWPSPVALTPLPVAPLARIAVLPAPAPRVAAVDIGARRWSAATRAPLPLPTPAEPTPRAAVRWLPLLARAEGGDPHAACELSLLLDDCRLAAAVGAMVDTQISMAAVEARDDADAAREIAALEASADALHADCASVPPDLVARTWSFVLRAAIAGHEPSMYRFVLDLPLDAQTPRFEQAGALLAYRDNAALFVGLLLQRASPRALALAFDAAEGAGFVAGAAVQRRDPVALVRLGTALLVLGQAHAGHEDAIARALVEVSAADGVRARADGQRLAQRLALQAPRPRAAAASGADECAHGWPGLEGDSTAYAY